MLNLISRVSFLPLRAGASFSPITARLFCSISKMSAQVQSSLSHEERTAQEPRETGLHSVILGKIESVNKDIRLYQLKIRRQDRGIKFLEGQWLDVHIPGLPKAGGFTITSTPYDAQPRKSPTAALQSEDPFLELAVQKSPRNPPAAWLWRPPEEILGAELVVRVGGQFTYPPPGIDLHDVDRVALVAGGVGINPLISMVSTTHASGNMPKHVRFLYTTKVPNADAQPAEILFVPRLQSIVKHYSATQLELSLFITSGLNPKRLFDYPERTFLRRPSTDDLINAVGDVSSRKRTLCYVCGPARMTDAFVAFLQRLEGMDPRKVLCEKWW